MTQLTDNIRESILGNIGTIISGRLGITDAEILQKKFMPTFDAEDLTKLPNYQTVTSVLINGVPSAAFSMSLPLPIPKPNIQLQDALKKLSSAKYGKPRAQVEKEIFARLGAGDLAKKLKLDGLKKAQQDQINRTPQNQSSSGVPMPSNGPSFLDEWLAKRQQISTSKATVKSQEPSVIEKTETVKTNVVLPKNEELNIRDNVGSDDEVSIKLR